MKTLSDMILNAYRSGVFPMAENARDDNFSFYKPHLRALVPIEGLHIPDKLRKTLNKEPYRVTVDQAFERIIDGCAEREETWINGPIRDIFVQLHKEGYAHSIECWDKDGHLAGGLYGLAIGAVFCGESMVSFQTDASKIALVHLCALLRACGYTLLDSQFINPHMAQFGVYEIPQADYETLIKTEMQKTVKPLGSVPTDHALLRNYLVHRKV